jgi:hypothetical protein
MGQFEESIKIVVSRKVELALLRLMKIPERIDFNCIEAAALEP